MGCNCKSKNNKPQLEEIKKEEITQQYNVASELISEMEKLIDRINEDPIARTKVSDFMNKTFGDVIINYCDAPCRKRLFERIEKLKSQIENGN